MYYAFTAAEGVLGDPISYREALESAQADQWRQATSEEYEALVSNGTWSLVERPKDVNVIGSRWVFKAKRDHTGNISRYKARFVAQGFSQVPGRDFMDTYSPVAKHSSIRSVLALAATEDWHVDNMDVDTAFLNASVKETIYVRQPEGFEEVGPKGEELVLRLHKSLYGLRQASHDWNELMDDWLKGYGLDCTLADPCVYVMGGPGAKGGTLIVVLYVDDLIIIGSDRDTVDSFKLAIAKRFKMKDLGALRWFLGMEVRRDRTRRTLELVQTTYIDMMLERFGMSQCKPVSTPAEGVLRRLEAGQGRVDPQYMSMVGSLLYAAMTTRPDIAYAVQALGRHLQASGAEHVNAAKRVLRYLKGTRELGIKFSAAGSRAAGGELVGYSDSDWGGDIDTRRSTTGYLFTMAGAGVSWKSRLQPTVALSSTEAEYMALCAATQEAVYMRQLLTDLGREPQGPTVIFEDNQGCIALVGNPVYHKRTKHIDVRYHFTRERVESGEVLLTYVATEHQLADLFTKALHAQRVMYLRGRVLGYNVVE